MLITLTRLMVIDLLGNYVVEEKKNASCKNIYICTYISTHATLSSSACFLCVIRAHLIFLFHTFHVKKEDAKIKPIFWCNAKKITMMITITMVEVTTVTVVMIVNKYYMHIIIITWLYCCLCQKIVLRKMTADWSSSCYHRCCHWLRHFNCPFWILQREAHVLPWLWSLVWLLVSF